MPRPNRLWCAIIVGLAVLVGCAKKKSTEPTDSGQAQAAPNPAPTPPPGTLPGGPGGGPAGRTSTVFTAEGAVTTPGKDGPKIGETPSTGTGGGVELVQCRFDLVEAALTAAKGKVVLVDCWARWCPPCISSFPKLVEKHEKYKGKGLVCISVSLDSGRKAFTTEQVHAFLKEQKATFQNFYLTDMRADGPAMDKRFGQISGIPHGVLFNKKGEKIWEGHPMDGGLVAKIEAELAK